MTIKFNITSGSNIFYINEVYYIGYYAYLFIKQSNYGIAIFPGLYTIFNETSIN